MEFRDRLQMLINCAHKQDGNFQDRWRKYGDAFTSAALQGSPLTCTRAYTIINFTVANSSQAAADHHDGELRSSLAISSRSSMTLARDPPFHTSFVYSIQPLGARTYACAMSIRSARINNARALRVSHDRMQVLKVVPSL